MKNLTVMLKPASSLCNMRCKYCFYADVSSRRDVASYGMMTQETVDAALENTFRDLGRGDRLTLAFQGGEPTLAGLDFYRHVARRARALGQDVEVGYALQTNGLLLNEEWCDFLRQERFLVGLSLDGPVGSHDAHRVDAAGRGTFRRVLQAKEQLDRYGVAYNVLITLTASLARHPQQVWRFLEEQDLRYVQLTPCLTPLSGERTVYGLTPARYAGFYTAFFDLWYQSCRRGDYRSVKLFDDLINLLAYGSCNACGLLGQCQNQIVVEADGSVYPCDFYVLDEYRVGNLRRQSLRQVWEAGRDSGFLTRPREPQPLCKVCPYRQLCGGGCPRMHRAVFYGPGDTQCGHRLFLDASIERLRQLAITACRRGR